MNAEEFRAHAHTLVDWMADYLRDVEQYPVRAQVKPGEILAQLPPSAPEQEEPFEALFADFQKIVLPGITHWQHPLFCAYFPANASPPSVLAEMLTATLGAQCMVWETSPAAAELEERCLEWLRDLLGLPSGFVGVIQDTASTATLAALLSARERATDFTTNHTGLYDAPRFVVYASQETHSSLDKALRIAGLGSDSLRKLPVDANFALKPEALADAIAQDRAQGRVPLCVVATLGTTSSTAVDPLAPLAQIARRENLWLHVDAAYGGSALILPELRHLLEGIDGVDSFVFNPHKWLFTNFDCSAYFVRDKATLIRTFEILPEYLKTGHVAEVNNYRDWGVPLGRRFRALKLWFVLRSYGAEGLRARLRQHIAWAQELREGIASHPEFEVLAPSPFGLVCFRYAPPGSSEAERERLNTAIKDALNADGALYLTHTKLNGTYTLRLVVGQTGITRAHVQKAWALVRAAAAVARIALLFARRGEEAYYGEPVSQAAHALQSAALAHDEGAPDTLIAAALLHDIGHLFDPEDLADNGIDGQHEEQGARWLSAHFPESVTEPIRLHVPAKRYLCAVDPAYRDGLSLASVQSLALQGGPFPPQEVAAFERHPWFAQAVRLRRWDDTAKVVGRDVPPLEAYLPLLRSLAR